MALMTVQQIARTGITPSYAAVASSDTFANNGKVFLHVKNGSGGSINVTVTVKRQVDGQTATARTVAVGAGAEAMLGPFDPADYADPDSGLTTVNYSATTTVTAAAFRLPSP